MRQIIFFIFFIAFSTYGFANKNTYKDKSKSIEFRVDDLLNRMTLDEKIAQLRHIHQRDYDSLGEFSLTKLKEFVDGKSFGAIEAFGYSAENYLKVVSKVNTYMRENTRLGIPVMPIMEGLHGVRQDGSTIFPQSLALASTFNPDMIYEMAKVIGKEMKAIGGKQNLSPVLDIAREQRWGRVEETYGEDPYLISVMGVNYVKGIRSENLVCCPKHYIAHGSPTSGLNLASVEGGKNSLMNIYLQPFKKVIEDADPLSIMNCYSSYEGEPITGSKFFMNDLLRDSLKFKGYVYSDWGSISMLNYFHRVAQNEMEAAYQALTAGIDMEASSNSYRYLKYLVENKILDEKYIDRAVKNVLYVKMACGLFDEPIPKFNSDFKNKLRTPEARILAKQLADESIVLLKNENNFLPLDIDKIKSVAVIGPNADMVQVGGYSWTRSNKDGVSPLQGITAFVNGKAEINYAKGCDLLTNDSSSFAQALLAAKKSDVALVFVGSQSGVYGRNIADFTSGEGFDLTDIKLPGVQEELLKAVAATGTPTVLVLIAGKPFKVNWAKNNLPAIITQFYGGEEQGNSIAEVLFGKVNPSGKLPITFAKEVGQLPIFYNYFPSDKGIYKKRGSIEKPGRDYVFSDPYPDYVFGYGLSYTDFLIDNISFSKEKLTPEDTLHVSLSVKNIGAREGKEVVQLYVRDLFSSIVKPVKELKAFKKISVPKGETTKLTLSLPMKELMFFDKTNRWIVEPGDYEIQIGNSSSDISYKKTIEIVDGNNGINHFKKQPVLESKLISSALNDEIVLKGEIKDIQATSLPDVTITTGKNSARANLDGSYTIVAKIGEKIKFSLQGYKTIEKTVTNDPVINVTMTIE